MEVIIVHPVDPFMPAEGGSVRYALNIAQCLQKRRIHITFLGVKTTPHQHDRTTLAFIPINRNSDNWILYGLNLLQKVPFLDIPESAVILTLRLDYMFPFVLFKPRNPKVMVSDEPLRYARLRFPRVFRLIAAIYHLIESFCLRRIDLLLTDDRTKVYYLRRYPWLKSKLLVSPAYVDLEKFKPLDKKKAFGLFGFKSQDRIIAFIGRIAPVKNLDFLIRSFVIVKKRLPQAKLVIVGRGEDKDETRLRSLVDELCLEGIVFTGEIHPDKVPWLLNCTKVLALCSLAEGSPTVVKEALACGVPVVSTDVGDTNAVITNELLGKVVTGDEEAFAEALIEVMSRVVEKPEEIRNECVKAVKSYSLKVFGQRITKFFECASARRGV